MSLYAVGDLQGCYDDLRRVLEKAGFDPATDTLWLTGDLVNRGPQSLACLRFVKGLGAAALTVLGNHDLHLLALARGGAEPKKKDTLKDIFAAGDCGELLHWLQQQPLMAVDEKRKLAMVHAGIYPGWTLTQAHVCAQEVEAVLQSDEATDFFRHMYGNEPQRWSDDLPDELRWRFITNAFTRMRLCSADDTRHPALELRYKEGVAGIPAGYVPWFKQWTPPPDWRVLFGHWAALEAHTGLDNIIALDSGCVWGRHLTLLRIDDGQYFFSS